MIRQSSVGMCGLSPPLLHINNLASFVSFNQHAVFFFPVEVNAERSRGTLIRKCSALHTLSAKSFSSFLTLITECIQDANTVCRLRY